jgi:hypothetical protein
MRIVSKEPPVKTGGINSTGYACPPKADISIYQLKLVVLKSEE